MESENRTNDLYCVVFSSKCQGQLFTTAPPKVFVCAFSTHATVTTATTAATAMQDTMEMLQREFQAVLESDGVRMVWDALVSGLGPLQTGFESVEEAVCSSLEVFANTSSSTRSGKIAMQPPLAIKVVCILALGLFAYVILWSVCHHSTRAQTNKHTLLHFHLSFLAPRPPLSQVPLCLDMRWHAEGPRPLSPSALPAPQPAPHRSASRSLG
jgi:hypothetical protein